MRQLPHDCHWPKKLRKQPTPLATNRRSLVHLDDIDPASDSLQRIRHRQPLVVVAVDTQPNAGVSGLDIPHDVVHLLGSASRRPKGDARCQRPNILPPSAAS